MTMAAGAGRVAATVGRPMAGKVANSEETKAKATKEPNTCKRGAHKEAGKTTKEAPRQPFYSASNGKASQINSDNHGFTKQVEGSTSLR